MEEKILEFEKKLISLRTELNEITAASNTSDSAIVKDKLNFLKTEMLHINRQYEMLTNGINAKQATPQPVQQPIQQPIPQPIPQPAPQPVSQPVPQPVQQPAYVSKPVAKKKNTMENAIGSSLMGIFASGLIFISLILFATLVLPYMTDVFKMLACYLISGIMITVAMIKLKKNVNSPFFISLGACGTGSLLISLFLTDIYFGYINDWVLFICIAIWVFFVCYLSKTKSVVFQVIGHIGIFISIMFGTILCSNQNDEVKFIMLILFFFVSALTMYVTHYSRNVEKNVLNDIFGMLNILLLTIGAFDIFEDGVTFVFYIIISLIVAYIIVIWTCKWENAIMSYGVNTTFWVLLLILNIAQIFEDEVTKMVTAIVAMTFLVLLEFKKKNDNAGKYFAQSILALTAFIGLAIEAEYYDYGFVVLFILPLAAIAAIWKNDVCKYFSVIATFIYLFNSMEAWPHLFLSLLAVLVLYVIYFYNKEGSVYKGFLHIVSVFFFVTAFENALEEIVALVDDRSVIIYTIVVLFNLGMYIWAKKNYENKEVYNVVNFVTMFFGIGLIVECTSMHLLVIMVTILVFMFNSKNYLDGQKMFAGMYVGFKLTVLMLVILASFDSVDYVISIACIIFAIASIVTGFRFKYKALRIYGLTLAMIGIFKLVMIDINYENTLGNALSFFISGILCFGISLIYNYIGKRLSGEDS